MKNLSKLSYEELQTLYNDFERVTLESRLNMGNIARIAIQQYGVSYADFARDCGCSYSSVREYGRVSEVFAPVENDLLALLKDAPSLKYTHVRLAKRGLGGLPPQEAAHLALQRLRDWAAVGLSPEKAAFQVDEVKDAPYLKKEFEGTRGEIVKWIYEIRATLTDNTRYRVAIYKVD